MYRTSDDDDDDRPRYALRASSGERRAEAASHNVRLAPYSATGMADDDTAAVGRDTRRSRAGGGEVYLPAGTYKLARR